MSKHVFTVEVECDSPEEYERAVHGLSAFGQITNEESDFEG